jgi:hypothetical protein
MPESTPQPEWEERAERPGLIEHLVARQEDDGRVVILGLDVDRRAVYTTTFNRRP